STPASSILRPSSRTVSGRRLRSWWRAKASRSFRTASISLAAASGRTGVSVILGLLSGQWPGQRLNGGQLGAGGQAGVGHELAVVQLAVGGQGGGDGSNQPASAVVGQGCAVGGPGRVPFDDLDPVGGGRTAHALDADAEKVSPEGGQRRRRF